VGLILLIVLIVLLVGGLPTWGYSRDWGYRPSGGLGLVLVIVLILLLLGYIPRGFLIVGGSSRTPRSPHPFRGAPGGAPNASPSSCKQ